MKQSSFMVMGYIFLNQKCKRNIQHCHIVRLEMLTHVQSFIRKHILNKSPCPPPWSPSCRNGGAAKTQKISKIHKQRANQLYMNSYHTLYQCSCTS